jgi:hypothetical protein
MSIALIRAEDCISNGDRNAKGKGKVDCSSKNCKVAMFKKITNRDRKRCYKCGQDGGVWYEQFLRGRSVYHFLCQDCINRIENIK